MHNLRYSGFFFFLTIVFFLGTLKCSSQIRIDSIADFDGNIYHAVDIGGTLWMCENLKTSHLNDGTPIEYEDSDSLWISYQLPRWCWYNNEKGYESLYGALYNWYCVETGKLCPLGWRVPGEEDWKLLSGWADSLHGAGDPIWSELGMRGFDAGKRLRACQGWSQPFNGTDDFGFGGLPAGERSGKNGRFHLGGINGYWWSSKENSDSTAYYRSIIYSLEGINRQSHPKQCGFSVRCVRKNK